MERYIKEISQCRLPDCNIMISDSEVAERDYKNTIVLMPSYFESCSSVTELTNALSKRLKTQQLCSIAIGCICSYGYTLNHTNIGVLQAKEFMSIWGHLETLKKSSSAELSKWLSTCIGRRSQEGYSVKLKCGPIISAGNNSTTAHVHRRWRDTKVTPIGIVFSEMHFGEATTVRDAMMADAKTLSAIKFVFGEPILDNEMIAKSQH
jgi:hypothetical protein